jgi:hypothetical protein
LTTTLRTWTFSISAVTFAANDRLNLKTRAYVGGRVQRDHAARHGTSSPCT